MNLQAQAAQIFPCRLAVRAHLGTRPTVEEKIIDVADVAFHPQFLLHEVVKPIQIHIGKKLAG